jgi:hypothetical protein
VVLLGSALAFLVLVALRLHGFSLPVWHAVLDRSRPEEVLLGEARTLRSDDWVVTLPRALAQSAHDPPFPRVNRNIGMGEDVILTETPIAHPATLFRPTVWGFFLGRDVGIAWSWWSPVLGCFVAWFLALRGVAPGRVALAALGGLILLLSPYMQFWSFGSARLASYAGLALAGGAALLRSERTLGIWGGALLLVWSAGCLGLAMYPPWQVVLTQLVIVTLAGLWWEGRKRPDSRRATRLAAAGVAGALTLAVAVGFLVAAAPAIERILATDYPGGRIASGGGVAIWRVFAHDLAIAPWVASWEPVLNIAEGASFWLLWPVVAAGVLREAARGRADALSIALLLYLALLLAHLHLGLPGWLAQATGLDWVPPPRALLAVGLADALLLIRFLDRGPALGNDRLFALGAAALFAAALAACAVFVQRGFAELPTTWLLALALANGGLAFLVLERRRPATTLGALAALLAVCTLWFNPLVRGGSDYLLSNPLSRRIVELDREAGGESVWVSYGPPYAANLFRVLGVRALTGIHYLPQLEIWGQLDPEGRYRSVYNRYAHVTARSAGRSDVRFRLAAPDAFEVIVEPGAPALRGLGVTHVLIVAAQRPDPARLSGVEWLFSHAHNHLYRVVTDPTTPQPESDAGL